MTGKIKFIGLLFCTFALLMAGCGSPGQSGKSKTSKVDKVRLTPTEQKKAKLLKQLDRKFEDPDAHFELGQLYQADGLWAKAEYEYNIALSFNPAHRDAQAAIVKVLRDSGETAKSGLSAEIYVNQTCASAEDSLRLGMAFQKQQMDDYALVCYQQALQLAPNSAKINRQIGYYYLSKGDKVRAQEYLTRSFQLNPNQPEVAGELGRLGIAVKIPRKTEKDTKKLDKIVEQSDKQAKP
jgi:tetratricopeptide (TPR) repeat protein